MTSISRRRLLQMGLGCGLAVTGSPLMAGGVRTITAREGEVALVGPDYPKTRIWGYDGLAPGPLLRLKKGVEASFEFKNLLPQPSTVHWHGLRIPLAMDGVPDLSQTPVHKGEAFTYRFTPPDSGTFWYHSHLNGQEQVDRGLGGPLIVEEENPPQVDRELVWFLDDWRLNRGAQVVEDFDNRHDMSHAGRLGNSVTVNGRIVEEVVLRSAERVRLRLINGANARVFALNFKGHRPWIVALDGQPCKPFEPPEGRVVVGPAMRADLILDCQGDPGERFEVIDDHYGRRAYRLLDLAYSNDVPLRTSPLDAPIALDGDRPLEPKLSEAQSHVVELQGGAMGGLSALTLEGKELAPRELASKNLFWGLSGVAGRGHRMTPLLNCQLARSQHLILRNATAFEHPMHLHGHHMKILSRDGVPEERGIWHDTVLVRPRETVELAFVADNPGKWLFHCHILEHMKAGMTGVLQVG